MPHGGNFGTVNFIWKLPLNKEDEDDTANDRAIVKVTDLIPEFHLWQMHCDFIEKYKNAVKLTNKSLMHFLYQDLTGGRSSLLSSEVTKNQAQVAEFISQTEKLQLLLDLRKLNGNPKSTKYDEFWEEINILFNEYQTAVQERRHDNIAYLPFTISIRELIERVQKRKPGILTPSEEWVRLKLCPENL